MELMELTSRPNQKTSFTSSNELEKFLMTIAKKKEKHNRKSFVTVWSAIVS